MVDFKRYRTPTYPLDAGDAFPGTIGSRNYALANNLSGGTGTPPSAPVDAELATGPNAGTVLVGFKEDADAKAVNRGLVAVLNNTDFIDNLLRAPQPYMAYEDVVLASSSMLLSLTGDVFVGEYLATSTAPTALASVMKVVGGSEVFALTNSNTVAVVADVRDTAGSTSVIGTAVTGFYTAPKIQLNAALPAGTYRVYLGRRSSVAGVAEKRPSALFSPLMSLRNYTVPFSGIFTQGLDDKYRRSTNPVSSAALDTPGSGATIVRDGGALTVQEESLGVNYSTKAGGDFSACVYARKPNLNSASRTAGYSGWVGFATQSAYLHETGYELGARGRVGADFASHYLRNLTNAAGRTNLPYNISATLNPGGAGASMVRVTAPYFFASGTGATAIRPGQDFLNVFSAGVMRTYRIATIVDAVTVTVTAVDGAAVSFSASAAATISLYQRVFAAHDGGVTIMAPSYARDGYTPTDTDSLWSGALKVRAASTSSASAAVTWGGYDSYGAEGAVGRLMADGSMSAVNGTFTSGLNVGIGNFASVSTTALESDSLQLGDHGLVEYGGLSASGQIRTSKNIWVGDPAHALDAALPGVYGVSVQGTVTAGHISGNTGGVGGAFTAGSLVLGNGVTQVAGGGLTAVSQVRSLSSLYAGPDAHSLADPGQYCIKAENDLIAGRNIFGTGYLNVGGAAGSFSTGDIAAAGAVYGYSLHAGYGVSTGYLDCASMATFGGGITSVSSRNNALSALKLGTVVGTPDAGQLTAAGTITSVSGDVRALGTGTRGRFKVVTVGNDVQDVLTDGSFRVSGTSYQIGGVVLGSSAAAFPAGDGTLEVHGWAHLDGAGASFNSARTLRVGGRSGAALDVGDLHVEGKIHNPSAAKAWISGWVGYVNGSLTFTAYASYRMSIATQPLGASNALYFYLDAGASDWPAGSCFSGTVRKGGAGAWTHGNNLLIGGTTTNAAAQLLTVSVEGCEAAYGFQWSACSATLGQEILFYVNIAVFGN